MVDDKIANWLNSMKFEPGKSGSLMNIVLILLNLDSTAITDYVKEWWKTDSAERQLAEYSLLEKNETEYTYTKHGSERLRIESGFL